MSVNEGITNDDPTKCPSGDVYKINRFPTYVTITSENKHHHLVIKDKDFLLFKELFSYLEGNKW